MSLITPTQTALTSYLASADTTTTNVRVGDPINVAGKRAIYFLVKMGRRSGTAFTSGYPQIRFEASQEASGDRNWVSLHAYQMAVGASVANTTLSAAISSVPATSFTVAAATNIAVGDILFVKGDADSGNEFVRVRSVSGSTINLDTGTPITVTKSSGNAVTDQAECPPVFAFSCEAFRRFRAVIDNSNGGQTVAAEVAYSTYDADDVT
jgi:hypothetical protein